MTCHFSFCFRFRHFCLACQIWNPPEMSVRWWNAVSGHPRSKIWGCISQGNSRKMASLLTWNDCGLIKKMGTVTFGIPDKSGIFVMMLRGVMMVWLGIQWALGKASSAVWLLLRVTLLSRAPGWWWSKMFGWVTYARRRCKERALFVRMV